MIKPIDMSDNKKQKLAIITNTLYSFGGGERWALEVATTIKNKFHASIINPTSKADAHKISLDQIRKLYNLNRINIIDINCIGPKFKEFNSDEYILRIPTIAGLKSLFSAIKSADVIYLLSFNPIIFSSSILLSKLLRKRLILGIHNPTFFKLFEESKSKTETLRKGIFIQILKLVNNFHVLNNRDDLLVKRHLPNAKTYLIPNFISKSYARKIKVNKKDFITLFVGRLETSQKGIDLLESIIKQVAENNKNIKFHIIGKGGNGEMIITRLSKKYPKNVKWFGFVSDKILQKEYANASMLAFPSRYEAFGIVLLEAQNHGLPVVAFNIPGPQNIIEPNKTGVLIKNFNTEKFTDAIIDYYNLWSKDKGAYIQLKRNISKEIGKKYSKKTIIPKIEEVLIRVQKGV